MKMHKSQSTQIPRIEALPTCVYKRRKRRITGVALVLMFVSILVLGLGSSVPAQRTSSTSSAKGFILTGDVKVDESGATEPGPTVLDVILYTNGNQVFGRQRITPNGRYRFMDVFAGEYYVVIEVESKEVARANVYIAATSPTELKQDFSFEWRANNKASNAGVVSAADAYARSESGKALYQRARRSIESKDYKSAITQLQQIVSADPKDYPAWNDLGMLYFIQKDYEKAEKSYAECLAAKPDHFEALLSVGRIKLAKQDLEGAAASLEAALKVDQKSASANFFLGETYLQMKKGSKAVVYLNEAIAIDPVGMANAHLRLGALYNAANLKDKAAQEYEAFLKVKPDYPERKKLEEYIAANKKQ